MASSEFFSCFFGEVFEAEARGRQVFRLLVSRLSSSLTSPLRHLLSFENTQNPARAKKITTSRQFSHRVKGVSLATFKPEEVAALEETGNALVLGTYLARWSPSDLPKPTGREPASIADWVEAVFVKKRFYAEPDIGSGRVSCCVGVFFYYFGEERCGKGGVLGQSTSFFRALDFYPRT